MRTATYGLLLGLFAFATLGSVATADVVWLDPDEYAVGTLMNTAGTAFTLSSIDGPHDLGDDPHQADGNVWARPGPGGSGDNVFGWRDVSNQADFNQWRGNWADMRIVFDQPVAYVAIQYQRSDPTEVVDLRVTLDGTSPDPPEETFTFDGEFYTKVISHEVADIVAIETSGYARTAWEPPNYPPDPSDPYYGLGAQDVYIHLIGYSVDPVVEVIPEPASVVGLAIGLLGVLALGRRRRCR